MSAALSSPLCCPAQCDDPIVENIPGPQGLSAYQIAVEEGFVGTVAEWLTSLEGANGQNSYTALTLAFTQPAVGATAPAAVVSSGPFIVGEDAFLEGGGYYLVTAIPDATHVTLQNRGYTANSAPGTVIAIGSRLAPTGERGAAGAAGGGGDMNYADNLNAMASPDTSLANLGGSTVGLGFFKMVSPSAITFPRINADNTVTPRSAANLKTDLGLGTMADQSAAAVAITGGAINGTLGATTPATAVVTTLQASGAATLNGAIALNGAASFASKAFLTSSAIQSLLAATSINPNAIKVRVAGNGGPITVTAMPSITSPVSDGQLLIIQGTDATNTVTLQDEATLAGTQLELGAATRLLGLGDTIGLLWDSVTSKWYELFFTNN